MDNVEEVRTKLEDLSQCLVGLSWHTPELVKSEQNMALVSNIEVSIKALSENLGVK